MSETLPHKIAMAVNRAEENCFKKGVGTTKAFKKLRVDLARLIPDPAPDCSCGQEGCGQHDSDCDLLIWAKEVSAFLLSSNRATPELESPVVYQNCPDCDGTGEVRGGSYPPDTCDWVPCPTCQERGIVKCE